jgi:hypothetical protein
MEAVKFYKLQATVQFHDQDTGKSYKLEFNLREIPDSSILLLKIKVELYIVHPPL